MINLLNNAVKTATIVSFIKIHPLKMGNSQTISQNFRTCSFHKFHVIQHCQKYNHIVNTYYIIYAIIVNLLT